ncbi:hypothetical protein W911_06800 [Hyphomicrobium nitrativorans NL23]|uniref:Secreted protein n=1 Tax=Hyphomicrobium nitrativorans NL23 TaxID=1029756 RepID=V5SGQ8_9HYPH|nr:hypothetical protein [Hyphomicrobium nitrativorans]AHB50056.1 hypothetical protein W911_06800 [Hyphomicrobium nitrativorans NL23]
MQKYIPILTGVCLTVGLSAAVGAAEYCVTCEGPPALYRCVIDGQAEGPGKDPRASIYCISEMARQGKHERCAVSRGAPFPCPGLTALVKPQLDGPAHPDHAAPYPDPQSPQDTLSGPEGEADTAKAPAEPTSKVPRTVEELAGQTVRSSKEGLEKAGEAIGGSAKKAGEGIGKAGSAIGQAASNTWTCITSLFASCGDAPESEPQPAE